MILILVIHGFASKVLDSCVTGMHKIRGKD